MGLAEENGRLVIRREKMDIKELAARLWSKQVMAVLIDDMAARGDVSTQEVNSEQRI